MKQIHVVLFLMISLQVKAMVESPRGCLQQNINSCYFGSISKVLDYKANNEVLMHIGKNSVLEKNTDSTVFHEGEILLEVPSEFSLKIKNTQIDFIKGEYYIKNQNDAFVVRTIQGEAKINLSSSKLLQVTEGFDLNLLNKGEMGLEPAPLKVIPMEDHLLSYSRLMKLDKASIVKYTQTFRKKHENYLHWSAELNEKLVQRQIAAQEDAENQRKAKEQMKQAEQARMRKQLFEKAFER